MQISKLNVAMMPVVKVLVVAETLRVGDKRMKILRFIYIVGYIFGSLILAFSVISALTSVENPELAVLGFLGFLSFFGIGAGIIVSSALIHAADNGLRLLEEIRDRLDVSDKPSPKQNNNERTMPSFSATKD